MSRRESNLIAAVIVLSVLLLVSLVANALAIRHGLQQTDWQRRYSSDVEDVARLAAHYAKVRQETGKWPPPDAAYLTNYRCGVSTPYAERREDIYGGSPRGPWLIVKLGRDGTLEVDVTEKRPEGFER